MARSDLRSVCLWNRVSAGEFESVGCRPVHLSRPGRVGIGASDAQWLDQGGPMVWRVTEAPLFGAAEGGRVYLTMSTGGLLLEVCSEGDLSERDVHEVSTLLGSMAHLMGDHEDAPDSVSTVPTGLEFELLDLTFVESVAMGDRDFVVEILSMSLQGFAEGWDAIRASLDEGDRAAASAEAHKLRSTARTVGASLVDEALLTLETAVDLPTARTRQSEVGVVVSRIRAEIQATLHGIS